jgi:DNA invertase Pin-like site-specific DNA recombinase
MIGRLLEFMGSHADQVGERYPIIKNSIELPLNQETISQYRASALPPLIARAAEFDRRWTKTFKPAMIRQRNHQRIIADLLRLPQSLKPLQEIRALLLMGLLLSSHEQATFADIESHDSADETENNEQTEDYVVIIYSRVSSNEQSRKGRSVENQEEVLTSIIEGNPTMRTYTDEPIRDEGETGTDFDREGIKRVAKLAQYDEVTHVMIDTIDRLGRDVEQTLRFIRFLRKECDVKLLVRSTEYDFSDPDDKLSFTMRAMVAEFGTMTRARNALQSSAKGFADNKNWSSWYQSIPMGYEQKGNEKIMEVTKTIVATGFKKPTNLNP